MTINENAADIAGLKLAYAAYEFTTQLGHTAAEVPGLNYTSNQLSKYAKAKICRAWGDVSHLL